MSTLKYDEYLVSNGSWMRLVRVGTLYECYLRSNDVFGNQYWAYLYTVDKENVVEMVRTGELLTVRKLDVSI